MKIAIFGDSFGDSSRGGSGKEQENSWPSLLKQVHGYTIDNYALVGSGLDWSFSNLMEHGKAYDKIIFIGSNSEREFLNPLFHKKIPARDAQEMYYHYNPNNMQHAGVNYSRFEEKLKKNLQTYHAYFWNHNFHLQRQSSYYLTMKKVFGEKNILCLNIQNEDKNIPADYWYIRWDNKLSLIDVMLYESKFLFGHTEYNKSHNIDRRSCHITHYHHDMLYKKIIKWLDTGEFSLTKKDLVKFTPAQISEIKKRYVGEW